MATFKFIGSFFTLIYLMTMSALGQTSIKLTRIDKAKLPAVITGEKHGGIIKDAVQWTDVQGVHLLISSETGVYQNEGEGGSSAELFAWHYIVNKDAAELTWKVTDFIKDCPVDIETHFLPGTFTVTDLNKDGITEIWLMYVTVCHGDVSPMDMKIIMYEGSQKFAMRGQNKIRFSPNEFMGGEYKFDEAFSKGPATFRAFAKKMWNKHILGK